MEKFEMPDVAPEYTLDPEPSTLPPVPGEVRTAPGQEIQPEHGADPKIDPPPRVQPDPEPRVERPRRIGF